MKQKNIREAESIWVKKSVRVQETRGVRDRLTLSALCRLLCAELSVYFSIATFFSSDLLQTLFRLSFFFFLLSLSLTSQQLCLFHVLFCFIVCQSRSCTADFYLFQTLFSTRRLFLLCLMTHYLNEDFQFGTVHVRVCWCLTTAMYETV